MSGRTLGEAWVTISPDTAGFRAAMDAGVRKAMAGFNPTVKVTVDITTDTAKMRTEMQTAVSAATKGLRANVNIGGDTTSLKDTVAKTAAAVSAVKTNLNIGGNTTPLTQSLAKTVAEIMATKANVKVGLNDDTLEAQLAALAAKAEAFQEALGGISTKDANTTAFLKGLADGADRIKDSIDNIGDSSGFDKANSQLDRMIVNADNVRKALAAASQMGGVTGPTLDPEIAKELDALKVSGTELADILRNMPIKTDDEQAVADLNVLQSKAGVLVETLKNVDTNIGVTRAAVQLATLEAAAVKFKNTLNTKDAIAPDLGLQLSLANSQFTHLAQNAKNLKAEIESALSPGAITIGKVTDAAREDLNSLSGGADALLKEIDKLGATGIVNDDDIARVKTLTSGLGQLSAAVAADGVTLKSATGAYHGWVNAIISIAKTQIPLFNGALTGILPHMLAVASGTHMIIEAGLELVAVWVPAAVALTVFGVAAAKTAVEVASDVKNMAVAANGTGEQFQGMAKKIGTSMSDIAKPYVFEAYGLALVALQKQSTTTAGVIQNVGGTIDKWISEAVIAYQKGTGQMAVKGASDFAMLGNAFKSLGTAINAFLKITPGYATDLLKLGSAALAGFSALLNSPIIQWFGKLFLAVHGAIFYLGLFATLGTMLGQKLLSPLARVNVLSGALGNLGVSAKDGQGKMSSMINAITTGWQQGTGKLADSTNGVSEDIQKGLAIAFNPTGPVTAADKLSGDLKTTMEDGIGDTVETTGSKFKSLGTTIIGAMSTLGGAVETSAKGIKGALAGMLDSLGINPVLLGVIAIGAAFYLLATHIHTAQSAAQQFGSAAQTALSNSTIATFGTTMQLQMKEAQSGLEGAKNSLDSYTKSMQGSDSANTAGVVSYNSMGQAITSVGANLSYVKGNVAAWQTVVGNLQATNTTFNNNLNQISKTAGVDLPTAMNLATQAGLSVSDMETKNATTAEENALQVEGLAKGYASLMNGIGGVNTAYQAMNIQSSQTMKDAQSVASAFQNYTTLITGGVGAFDTFVQGQATLASNLGQTNEKASTVTLTLGKMQDKMTLTGAALDGTSAASVTANQSFLAQINQGQALYGTLIQLAAASGNTSAAQHALSVSGKDIISTLLQTAGGSKEAQQQIYSLAQTFGYTGTDVLPQLVKWLGTTGDKTTDLQKQTNIMTKAAGNLATAAKALSGSLGTGLQNAMSQSIIAAEGGQTAFNNYAKSIQAFAKDNSSKNFNDMITQGKNLASVFISAAGGAKQAEPALQNYMMTLGMSSTAAKGAAEQILGLGGGATKTVKPVQTLTQQVVALSKATNTPTESFQALENSIGKVSFTKLIEDGKTASGTLNMLQTDLHLSSNQANVMWKAVQSDTLLALSGHADTAESSFVKLLGQWKIAPAEADAIWAMLEKQNLDALSSKIGTNETAFKSWASQSKINVSDAATLWDTLAKNNFDLLGGDVDTNRTKFNNWATQAGLSKTAASDLWQQLLKNNLTEIDAAVDGNRTKFFNLMKQMGETQKQAQTLWGMLKQAPKVNATVTVTGGVTGQAQAVAQATGAQKQVIGKLFFAQRAAGGPIGKLAGWHNTGDNMIASSPMGAVALQGGEAVVPKNLATHPEFTSFAKKKGIPGFSSGGSVPGDNGGVPGSSVFPDMASSYSATRTNLANSQIQFAGDSIQASKIGAYNAFVEAATGAGGSATGQQILADAEKYNKHPYVFGGASNPSTGWDCSSFVSYVLGHDMNMKLPGGGTWAQDTSSGQTHGPVSGNFMNTPNFHYVGNSESAIQAGDILVWPGNGADGHVGFGVGPGKMFSAYGTAYGTIYTAATDRGQPPNVYRDGSAGGSGSGKQSGLASSSDSLTETMAKSATKDFSASSALAKMFPQLGAAGGDPGTAMAGDSQQNGTAIFEYLMANLKMTPIAAAGAIASMWGESVPPGWNPESIGTGGNGVMGWTPPLPGIVTGNATQDLDNQLPQIIKFVQDSGDMGVISSMNSATTVTDAADLWGKGVERYGISDIHAQGISAAQSILDAYNSTQNGNDAAAAKAAAPAAQASAVDAQLAAHVTAHMATGGVIGTLSTEHTDYVKDYNKYVALEKKATTSSQRKYYANLAAKYATDISKVDSQLIPDKAAKLVVPKPTDSVMKVAEALMWNPTKYISGSGSTSALGWALQPILGDLMIGKAMGPSQWSGKPSTNAQANSVYENWTAAMEAVGGYLQSSTGSTALKSLGKMFGMHGKSDAGVSFMNGGTVMEDVWGTGDTSGRTYKFHQGDQVTAPTIAATQATQGFSQEDRNMFIQMLNEMKKQTQLTAQAPNSYARALNGNASRKVGRP